MNTKTPNRTSFDLSAAGRFTAVLLLLLALLIWGLVLNVGIGSVSIAPGDVFSMLVDAAFAGLKELFHSGTSNTSLDAVVNATTQSQIIFSIRLPRMLLAALLGGALSVSGFLLQTFFRNPIAGPFVLGISSGAKMVVGISLIFLTPLMGHIGSGTLILSAFLGSLLITFLVLICSQRVHNMSMLLVIGIMVGYICSAVTDFCITFANEHDILNLTNWSMGTFSGADWGDIQASLCLCIPCLIAVWLLSKPMSAYALGEGYAQSLGINIKLFRLLLIIFSSLLSACVTALAGPISFVGIAVPHISRTLLKSSKPSIVIPTCFLCGSVFCVFCDLLARTAFAPTELAIGTVTSAFGAPIVIYIMLKRRKMQED